MRHNPLPLLSLALVSALLVSGPAFAAPSDSPRPAADNARDMRLNQKAVTPDEVRHQMQSGPRSERMAPDRHPGWNDDRRSTPPRWNGERHQNGPRWNDERPVPPMPPRQHYQPNSHRQDMRPLQPSQPGDDNGRWNRSYNGQRPDRPARPDRPGTHDIPFRYHR